MARLALALYEAGRGPREVLRECYGVRFPDEFFVIAEAAPRLMFHFTVRPWVLARPLDRGGPPQTTASMDSLDRKVLARDPDLVPLGVCLGEDEDPDEDGNGDEDTGLGDQFLCYRRTELAAGRSTVVSIDYAAGRDASIMTRANSLLAALHEHHIANATWVARERRRTAGHSGGGLDDEDVDAAHEMVTRIEELQRRVG
ncbi:MAG: hypothetical protein WBA97_22590 [Actinophytocola sp.]|uniref:hypothetical protein n=1 Tax=Actinophytocola sp. TaxID=1872138 RepID=UPI003C780F70